MLTFMFYLFKTSVLLCEPNSIFMDLHYADTWIDLFWTVNLLSISQTGWGFSGALLKTNKQKKKIQYNWCLHLLLLSHVTKFHNESFERFKKVVMPHGIWKRKCMMFDSPFSVYLHTLFVCYMHYTCIFTVISAYTLFCRILSYHQQTVLFQPFFNPQLL